jgi:hypothetical protein
MIDESFVKRRSQLAITMNSARFLTMAKRFFGPIICVTFVWSAFRWIAAFFKFAQLWPWCEFSPPPAQAYVLAVIGGISFGVAPLWLLAVFANIGWQWFRTPAARR